MSNHESVRRDLWGPLPREGFAEPGQRTTLEEDFRRFRTVSEAFVESLERRADFSVGPGGVRATELNLRLVRSIFGKWSLDILVVLMSSREVGFSELRRSLPGVSARVLSNKLKALESGGIVLRTVLATRPPRVAYALTERGRTITALGEPVLLYLRAFEGMYLPVASIGNPSVPVSVPTLLRPVARTRSRRYRER